MSTQSASPLIRRDTVERFEMLGIEVVPTVTKQMTGGRYAQFLQVAARGVGVPMHTHLTDEETMLVLEGHIVCRLQDERLGVGPGDTLHLPAGIPHGWCSDGDVPAVVQVTFSLEPGSDYERMFREIAEMEPDDFERGRRITSANGLELAMPPEFVES
jgi:quercetin dioxygenase-like cupin family protein